MPQHRTIGWITIALLASTLGCNVAPMTRPFTNTRPKDAPLTSARSPERIDPALLAGDIAIVDAQEVDMVEALLTLRARYHRSVEQLCGYYAERGMADKESWAMIELRELQTVTPFRYLLDAEVPSSALTASDSIPEADEMYAKGLTLMRRGGHDVKVMYDRDRMREAAREFRMLIERHPGSDKIDDAAFMLGEIHNRYLENQATLAVRWYQRAWTWDPNTPHPARYQSARVYDYRLHDRVSALELYQQVLDHEVQHTLNLRAATARIAELTREPRRRVAGK